MSKFSVGDVVSYDGYGEERTTVTIVPCPEEFQMDQWATRDEVVWTMELGDPYAHPCWMFVAELESSHNLLTEMVTKALTTPPNCDTMVTSTDERHKMNFSTIHAATILNMLDGKVIGNLTSDELTAYLALREYTQTQFVDISMNVPPNKVIDGIKMIRAVTGLGLKEAKDMYDRLDPRRAGGLLGPIARNVSREAADGIKAKYAPDCVSELVFSTAK